MMVRTIRLVIKLTTSNDIKCEMENGMSFLSREVIWVVTNGETKRSKCVVAVYN